VQARRGHLPNLGFSRENRVAVLRQHALRPVEVQQHQSTRWMTEVVHLRNGLLPAIAALRQMDGGTQPVQFVRDRAVIRLGSQARPPCRDAKRLEREGSGDGESCGGGQFRSFDQDLAVRPGRGWMLGRERILVATALHREPRIAPHERNAVRGGGREHGLPQCADGGEVCRTVRNLDAKHEHHAAEPGPQALGFRGFKQEPG
jgi:hypothetical protein